MDDRQHLTIFDDMVMRAHATYQLPKLNERAFNWFRQQMIARYTPTNTRKLFEDRRRLRSVPLLGKMFFFGYDPKHKDTLPYYDTFPFVLPIRLHHDGFTGLNMHYLPYKYRAKLMGALIQTVKDSNFDEKTRMRVTYGLLQSAAKYKAFAPTLKRYLYDHVKTRLVEVHSKEWPLALFLPVARWKKAKEYDIWKDSIEIING